ncbi:hypothetical protein NMY22_g10469 [Coprinellus aureogranulatus]|nr:hypothetical protein NMY22_g10469 [Coprinellus aureogranulatus]
MISGSFGPITPARSTRHASRRRVAGYPPHVRARQDARRVGTGIDKESFTSLGQRRPLVSGLLPDVEEPNLNLDLADPSIDVPLEHIIRGPALNIPCCAGAFVLSRKVPEVLLHPEAEHSLTLHSERRRIVDIMGDSPAGPGLPPPVYSNNASQYHSSQHNQQFHQQGEIRNYHVTQYTANNHPKSGRVEISEWLKAPRFTTIHRIAKEQRTDGTGTWFIESEEFQQYTQVRGCVLWCTGKPGSGKTILASTSIEHLRKALEPDSHKAVVYAYLRYDQSLTPRDVFTAILDQLLIHKEAIIKITPSYLEKKGDSDEYTVKEVIRILAEIVACLAQVYAVIDGLDEANDEVKDKLLEELPRIGVNLLIFSRPLSLYTHHTPNALQVSIQARTGDIALYMSEQFRKNSRLRGLLNGRPDLAEELGQKIKTQADGMFLLARLQLEAAMRNATSAKSLFASLEEMPSGINDMYRLTLRRIYDQTPGLVSIAQRVFVWLVFHCKSDVTSRDERTVEDVQRMLAVSVENRTWDEQDIPVPDVIFSACHGLVTVDKPLYYGRSLLRFVHYSTAEYLRKNGIPTIPDGHGLLAATCVLYLEHHIDFESKRQNSFDRNDWLLMYSVESWWKHTKKALWTEEAHFDVVCNTLARHPLYPSLGYHCVFEKPWLIPTLTVAAMHGCNKVVEKGKLEFSSLQTSGWAWPSLQTLRYINPFYAAACCGHFDTFRSLVAVYGDQGIRLWSSDNSAIGIPSILHSAAQVDTAVPFLQGLFNFVDSPTNKGENPSLYDFDVNDQDDKGNTALMLACISGLHKSAAARLFLERRDIQVNLQDAEGCTALMKACQFHKEDVVGILLANPNTEVNLRDRSGHTAFDYASRNLHAQPINTRIAALFLTALTPVDVEATDSSGNTSFMTACTSGHHSVIDHILTHRPNDRQRLVTHANKWGLTALMEVILVEWSGEPLVIIVNLLLKHGSDVNARDYRDRLTPLLHAVAQGRGGSARIRALLKFNPSTIGQCDYSGRTVLMFVARRGDPELTNLLLSEAESSHPDPSQFLVAQDANGQSALVYAVGGNIPLSIDRGFEFSPEESDRFNTLYLLLDAAGGWDASHIRTAVIAGVRNLRDDSHIYRLLLEGWVRYSFEWSLDDTGTVVLLAAAASWRQYPFPNLPCRVALGLIFYYTGLLEPWVLPEGVDTLDLEKFWKMFCQRENCWHSSRYGPIKRLANAFETRRSYTLEELQQRIRKSPPPGNGRLPTYLPNGARRAQSDERDSEEAFGRRKRARVVPIFDRPLVVVLYSLFAFLLPLFSDFILFILMYWLCA